METQKIKRTKKDKAANSNEKEEKAEPKSVPIYDSNVVVKFRLKIQELNDEIYKAKMAGNKGVAKDKDKEVFDTTKALCKYFWSHVFPVRIRNGTTCVKYMTFHNNQIILTEMKDITNLTGNVDSRTLKEVSLSCPEYYDISEERSDDIINEKNKTICLSQPIYAKLLKETYTKDFAQIVIHRLKRIFIVVLCQYR
jgi:hypothetical protein